MEVVVEAPPLHKAQRQVAKSKAREIVLICGRRWGKTRLGIVAGLFGLPNHIGALQKGTIWWVAPTYAVAGIAWRAAKQLAIQLPLAEIREADRVILCPGGGRLQFKSADRPDNLRGEGLDGLIVDEADFIERGANIGTGMLYHEVLRPALIDRQGWSLLISTPNVENGWLHRLFKEIREGRRPHAEAFHFTSYQNPYLPLEMLNELKEQSPELAFRREIMAEWVGAIGALVRAEWIRSRQPPPLDELDVTVGVDLAVSEKESADYTAMVALGRSTKEKVWYVLDAFRTRTTFAGIKSHIEAFAKKWNASAVAVESNHFQMWLSQELRKETSLPILSVRADRDKQTRFAPVAARYEQGVIYHSIDLPLDFEREVTAFPNSLHDDWVDALSYAMRASGTDTDYDWVELLKR